MQRTATAGQVERLESEIQSLRRDIDVLLDDKRQRFMTFYMSVFTISAVVLGYVIIAS